MFPYIATLYREHEGAITRKELPGVVWFLDCESQSGTRPYYGSKIYVPMRSNKGIGVRPGDWIVLGVCPDVPTNRLSEIASFGRPYITVSAVKENAVARFLSHIEVQG